MSEYGIAWRSMVTSGLLYGGCDKLESLGWQPLNHISEGIEKL